MEFGDNKSVYLVANFYNYKHLDWARAYCYENNFCPVSPQNILPFFHYAKKEFDKVNYIIQRLTLLNKTEELLLFLNFSNLKEELLKLDIFASTELYYWYHYKNKNTINCIDWKSAKVPKYINEDWSLTTKEKEIGVKNGKTFKKENRRV